MKRNSKSAKSLTGVYCLPTSTKYHAFERERSGAFLAGQMAFILAATQSVEEGGYPPAVALTCEEGVLDWSLDEEVPTQHAEVRKNLPPRKVVGVVMADGTTLGEVPQKGISLPHWELISTNEDGSANNSEIQATKDRIEANRKSREAEKQATRDSKKGSTQKAA